MDTISYGSHSYQLGKQDALIQEPLSFPSTKAFLETVTRHWRSNFVTTSITNENDLVAFMKRPSVLVVAVDGPMMTRWKRQQLLCGSLKCNHLRHIGPDQDPEEFTLENFVTNNDFLMHNGPRSEYSVSFPEFGTSLRKLISHAHLTIMNSFETIEELEKHLDEIDLLDAERLRPGWDQYFMVRSSPLYRNLCLTKTPLHKDSSLTGLPPFKLHET
jgi:dCMP deaminase